MLRVHRRGGRMGGSCCVTRRRVVRCSRTGILMVKVLAQAFFGQQAAEESQVGFAVLDGERTGGHRLGIDAETRLRIIGKDCCGDVEDGQVLKDEAVEAQTEQGQPRLQRQAIAGEGAIAAQVGAAGDEAMPGPRRAIGLQQAQGHFFADEGLQCQMGGGGQAIDVEVKQCRHRFAAVQAFDYQRGRGQGRFNGEQAGVLTEKAGEVGAAGASPRLGLTRALRS